MQFHDIKPLMLFFFFVTEELEIYSFFTDVYFFSGQILVFQLFFLNIEYLHECVYNTGGQIVRYCVCCLQDIVVCVYVIVFIQWCMYMRP